MQPLNLIPLSLEFVHDALARVELPLLGREVISTLNQCLINLGPRARPTNFSLTVSAETGNFVHYFVCISVFHCILKSGTIIKSFLNH